MKIFGWEVSEPDAKRIVIVVGGAVIGGGACYAILKRLLSSRGAGRFQSGSRKRLERRDGEPDLSLPLILEQEYGSFREICLKADPVAAQYLQEIPDHFFAFPQNFLKFVSNFVAEHTNRYLEVLVVGSRTGFLVFALGTIFEEVKGVESSFSQVVTCYQFQNLKTVTHSFPTEGAQKTELRSYSSPISGKGPFRLRRSNDFRKKYKENIEFINADLNKQPFFGLGKFQVVVLQNCLEDLEDPIEFLGFLKHVVADNGFLIISADYNWSRKLSIDLSDSDSFSLLKRVLEKDFEFKEYKNIPEVLCESLRSCRVRYNHCTAWMRVNVSSSDELKN